MKRRIYLILLAVSMLFTSAYLTGCEKYPDGPSISFTSREARVTNNWEAILISKNDIDIKQDFDYINMDFAENGNFTWTFKLPDDPTVYKFEGSNPVWELATLDEQIKISYFDNSVGDNRLLYFTILRLTSDELWINYIDNGDQMSLRLSPR